MRKLQLIGASVVAAAGLLTALPTHALSITPSTTPQCVTNDNSNTAAPGYMLGCFVPALTTSDIAALGDHPQYLNNVGSVVEEGAFAGSYDTTYYRTALDPQDATISWLQGTPYLDCIGLRCFLIVKDGKHEPASYAFEITGWNGTDAIVMTNFWPDDGAISHVEIWSGSQAVPEPSTLALFGLGLLGLSVVRRRVTAH